jgi:hypothetical protein
MAISKTKVQALTLQRLRDLLDPGRVYYRPVVFDQLRSGDIVQLQALVKGAQDLKAEYKTFDGLIDAAQTALRKAQG